MAAEDTPQTPPRPAARRSAAIRLLLVEGDPSDCALLEQQLASSADLRFDVERVASVEEAVESLARGSFQVVLLDLGRDPGDGFDGLGRVRLAAASVPIIVMTGQDDETIALRALRFGAQDYLVKGDSDARLVQRTLRHAVERHRILNDLALARRHEHYLATHDPLTGLPNRLAFIDQLRRTIAYSSRTQKQLAVLFVDLDRFKHINDSLGHRIGDELLKIVAERLSGILRESDMGARLGGDEFIIMLQDVQRDYDPGRVAQKITERLTSPCVLDGREYRVSASVGIALYPRDGTDHEALIRNADTAMHHAKADGMNRFSHYTEGMNKIVSRRLDVENGLRQALERDAFEVHYQPQVHVPLGEIHGAEALVRWRHPERGVVSPSEFMTIAEDTGLIAPIGEWVLRRACRDALPWCSPHGRPLDISVNVSTRQLSDPRFPDVVASALREAQLEPGRLFLEITESSVLQERGVTLASVEAVRRLGCRILIDDFGTGYSALSALKHFPVDGLKIDRSFVCDVVTEPADATITAGLIAIARGLGLKVVAEGVETREQLDFLQGLGCPLVQGYLLGKPTTAEELSAQLSSGSAPWELELRG